MAGLEVEAVEQLGELIALAARDDLVRFTRRSRPLVPCHATAMTSLYEAVGGFDAILALCRRWHQLCLADPIAAHPFEHGLHPQHKDGADRIPRACTSTTRVALGGGRA